MAIRFISTEPKPNRSFRTRSGTAPLDRGIEVAVTRAEYEALLKRVEALEAANAVSKAVNKPANKVNTSLVVNTERAGYMREYMRERRARKKQSGG